jgi:hypothetical protein
MSPLKITALGGVRYFGGLKSLIISLSFLSKYYLLLKGIYPPP